MNSNKNSTSTNTINIFVRILLTYPSISVGSKLMPAMLSPEQNFEGVMKPHLNCRQRKEKVFRNFESVNERKEEKALRAKRKKKSFLGSLLLNWHFNFAPSNTVPILLSFPRDGRTVLSSLVLPYQSF